MSEKPRLTALRFKFLVGLFVVCAIAFGLLSYKVVDDQSVDKKSSQELIQQLQSQALSQTTYQLSVQLKQKILGSLPKLQESSYFSWDGLEEFRALGTARWENSQLVSESVQSRNDLSLQKLKYYEGQIKKSDIANATHGYFIPLDEKSKGNQNLQKDILAVFSFQDRVVLSLIDANAFFALIDPFKKDGQDLFIWTQSGLALAHSTSEYFAKNFSSDPLFKSIIKTKLSRFTNQYLLGEKTQVVASFQKIDGTNLLAVSSKNVTEIFSSQILALSQNLLLGLATFIVLSVIVLIVFAKIEKQWGRSLVLASAALKAVQADQQLANNTDENSISSEFAISTPSHIDKISPEVSADLIEKFSIEKKTVVQRTTLSLAFRYLGEVVSLQNSILQLETKLTDAKTLAYAKTKEQVERLMGLTNYILKKLGETEVKLSQCKLQIPIEQVLKLMQPVFIYHGIRIQTEFSSRVDLSIDYMSMTRTVDSLLRFLVNQLPTVADEAIKDSHQREIRIRTFDDIEGTKMSIEFFKKIDSQIVEKALDPVGQLDELIKDSLNSTVLTLSATQGLIMAQGGQVIFRYEPHFQILIKFLNTAAAKVEENPLSTFANVIKPVGEVKMSKEYIPTEIKTENVKTIDVDIDQLLAIPKLDKKSTPESKSAIQLPLESGSSDSYQSAENTSDKYNNIDDFKVQIRKPIKRINL